MRPFVLLFALVVALCAAGGTAHAAVPGPYKGGDIELRVNSDRIEKISVLSYHTCQKVGTGEFYNELQRFTPKGGFRIAGSGKFSGSRYVSRVGEYFDIRFAWVGRFRGQRVRARIQTAYKYYGYDADLGTVIVSCFSEKGFGARRR